MFGKLALPISCCALLALDTVKAMFDCPEQTQTSPIITLLRVMVFFPAMVMSKGPPHFIGCSFTHQLPAASATDETFWPQNDTPTFSCGSAHPQIFRVSFCCRHMLLPTSAGSLTSASAAEAVRTASKIKTRSGRLRRM
jgi:hypothetical protein